MRRIVFRLGCAGAIGALLAGCEAEEGLGDARLTVSVNCISSTCEAPTTPVARGTQASFTTWFKDSTPDEADLPLVRAVCDINIELRRGGVLVRTFPSASTCPDSVIAGGDNWPGSINVGHSYDWTIPEDFPAGRYSITTVILKEPSATRTISFDIE
jgi:hypothetical protein